MDNLSEILNEVSFIEESDKILDNMRADNVGLNAAFNDYNNIINYYNADTDLSNIRTSKNIDLSNKMNELNNNYSLKMLKSKYNGIQEQINNNNIIQQSNYIYYFLWLTFIFINFYVILNMFILLKSNQ